MTDLLEQMRRNPRGDWTINDVQTVCRQYGVSCEPCRGGSSHYKVSHPKVVQVQTVPFKRPIKPVYIRKVVAFVTVVKDNNL